MILAVLPAILLLQEPVLLTYKKDADAFASMQMAQASKVVRSVPKAMAKPTFFTFRFGGKTRWLALGKVTGRQHVLIDQDGDGKLTDEKPLAIRKVDYSQTTAAFPMKWTIGSHAAVGQYKVRVFPYGKSRETVLLGSTGAWTGSVPLNGAQVPVTVTDFAGQGSYTDEGSVSFGDVRTSYMRCSIVGRDGVYQSIVVSPTGESVTVSTRRIPSKEVSFEGSHITIVAVVGSDRCYVEGKDGKVTVPEGSRLAYLEVTRNDDRGRTWKLAADTPLIYSTGSNLMEEALSVEEACNIEPLLASSEGKKQNNQWTFNLGMKAANGMSISGITVDGATPPPPLLKLSRNGKALPPQKFHYG